MPMVSNGNLFVLKWQNIHVISKIKYTTIYIHIYIYIYTYIYIYIYIFSVWPIFFFDNNFYKNKDIFKIFSPQLMQVYRILLVETTLESIMFYYTFSVINNMFAATRTLKLSATLLGISFGIHLISVLMMSSLVCGLFSQTLSFRYALRK